MKAHIIIARVQSRLNDMPNKPRFTQEEIINALDIVIMRMRYELRLELREFNEAIKENEKFILPHATQILYAEVNKKPLAKITLREISENPHTPALVEIEKDTFRLNHASGQVLILYGTHKPITRPSDDLGINAMFEKALTYGVLSDLLEIPNFENAEQKSDYYALKFENELNILRGHLNALREERLMQTPYIAF